jgi:hypothetical protein
VLQCSGKGYGIFGRPSFDDKARHEWIKHQQAKDHAKWEQEERQARKKKTEEDTAELLVL